MATTQPRVQLNPDQQTKALRDVAAHARFEAAERGATRGARSLVVYASVCSSERRSCLSVLIFAMYVKRSTPAFRRGKNEQRRCSSGRDRVGVAG